MPNPYVGQMVHYVSYGTPGGEYPSVCRAAVVAGIPYDDPDDRPPYLDLVVLNPEGMFFNKEVSYAPPGIVRGGSWHFIDSCVLLDDEVSPTVTTTWK